MSVDRPLTRYHGGKFRIGPWIISQFPPHSVYVEPFGGAASVLLQKDPARIEVYNDIEKNILNLFRVLRFPPRAEELRRALELTPFSRDEFESAFDDAPADPVESARRLLVRFGQAIGNKGRTQRSGWRTRTAKSRISPTLAWSGWPQHMPAIINRLRETIIESLPWQEIVPLYDDPDTLFYMDPPYPTATRTRSHRKMYEHEMNTGEHLCLLETAKAMRGMVALSSYPNKQYEDSLEPFGWTELRQRARAQTNAQRIEVLWLNPAAAKRRRQRIFAEEESAQ